MIISFVAEVNEKTLAFCFIGFPSARQHSNHSACDLVVSDVFSVLFGTSVKHDYCPSFNPSYHYFVALPSSMGT